jgi:DNA mismatch endonuclease (patch repair protein)
MPDVFTKAKRSEVMSRIRSRGNADTELALVRVFRAHGITGWRRHVQIRVRSSGGNEAQTSKGGRKDGFRASSRRLLRVRPDFVFRAARLAVFVDGCFWHACPQHCRMPTGNRAFWRAKLARNQARDRLVTRTLRKAGWRVLRIWEHALHRATTKRGGRKAERGKKKGRSTPHPGPMASQARHQLVTQVKKAASRPVVPVRGGEGAEARLLRRVQKALDSSPQPNGFPSPPPVSYPGQESRFAARGPRPRRRGRRGAAAVGAGQAR